MGEKPTANIVDACPECGSTDVTDTHGSTHARYQRPQYGCYDCGARFDNPAQVDTVTGEKV